MLRLTAALALLTVGLIGCAGDPVAPATTAAMAAPSPVVTAASPDGPNVWRGQTNYIVAVRDFQTDLWAFGGLPKDPHQLWFCGGTESFALVDVHDAGVRRGVIHEIAMSPNVNVHVYRLSTLDDLCTGIPLAQGTGSIKVTDSDYFLTGNGVESFGSMIQGMVTAPGGGAAMALFAHNRWLFRADGTARLIFRSVRMGAP